MLFLNTLVISTIIGAFLFVFIEVPWAKFGPGFELGHARIEVTLIQIGKIQTGSNDANFCEDISKSQSLQEFSVLTNLSASFQYSYKKFVDAICTCIAAVFCVEIKQSY